MACRLRHVLLVAIGCLPPVIDAHVGAVRVYGQERTASAFEVASVRLSNSDSTPMSVITTPGRFTATSIDLRNLITVAYRLPWFRIIGVPDWSERYDVVATMPSGTDATELGAMLQHLLAERFMMQAHMETRERPIYALVTARTDKSLGPQLQRASVDCTVALAARATRAEPPPTPASAVEHCDNQIRSVGHVAIRGMSLDVLANYLSGAVQDRVVVNRTGLEGNFDLELRFEPPSGGGTTTPGQFPSLFTAIQEQLGLKLEAQKGPVQVLVIDSIGRPSAN
jgi:uncharacterized protein (TIGR03435 family)